MHQILPHQLWIGSTGDLKDLRRLYDAGIQAVVQVAYEEPPLSLPHDIVACRFPLVDGDDNAPALLDLAATTLTHLLVAKFTCLVCCQAGLSRSPAVAAAALARVTKQPFDEWLKKLAQLHGCALHPSLVSQMRRIV